MLPNTTRYRIATTPWTEMAAGSNRDHSPVTIDISSWNAAPNSICPHVKLSTVPVFAERFCSSVPKLQPVVATNIARMYNGCALPDSVRVCITIVTTPAIATAVPNNACFVGARLLKNAQSKISTSTGTAATNSAAMPLGMPCCAQSTKPLPTPDSSTPAERHHRDVHASERMRVARAQPRVHDTRRRARSARPR